MPATPSHTERHISAEPLTQPAIDATYSDLMPKVEVPGYAIRRVVGRGGMGVVYEATQLGVDRTVALKMILSADFASPADLARFRDEARALGRIAHPNIVQIFDVGDLDGRPYFALEFCDGGTLGHHLDGTPWEPRRAAALVATLARAIHAAHQSGVIHRDLKPANILLKKSFDPGAGNSKDQEPNSNRKPVSSKDQELNSNNPDWNLVLGPWNLPASGFSPKVSDFGLAKQIGTERHLTRTGVVMGTASYMAPEQATGDYRNQGPPTDVYALGAILYELLTGRPPFRAAHDVETLLQVVHSDPVPPQRLQPKLPRDLATIVMRCLEKPARRRYPSAAALADDLERYLDGRPVLARPVGRGEQAWRWAKRNPSLACLTATSGLCLALAVAGLSVGVVWLARANTMTREALARTEKSQRDTLAVLNDVLSGAVATLLGQQSELSPDHKAFLQRAAERYDEIEVQAGASPQLREQAARARLKLSEIYRRLDQTADAVRAARDGRERFAKLVRDFPTDVNFKSGLADAYLAQGRLWARARTTHEGEQAIRHGLMIHEELVKQFPGDAVRRADLAAALLDWADLAQRLSRPDEATAAARRAEAVYRSLPGCDRDAVRAMLIRALALRDLKQFPEMEAVCRDALALSRRVAQSSDRPDDQETLAEAIKTASLSLWLQENGAKHAETERLMREVIAVRQQLVDANPAVTAYRAELARVWMNYGRWQHERLNHAVAAEGHGKALAVLQRLVEDNPAKLDYLELLTNAHRQLGYIAHDRSDWVTALDHYNRAIERLEPVVQRDARLLLPRVIYIDCLIARAGALARFGRFDEALRDRDTAIRFAPPDKLAEVRAYRVMTLFQAGRAGPGEVIAELTQIARGHGGFCPQLWEFADGPLPHD